MKWPWHWRRRRASEAEHLEEIAESTDDVETTIFDPDGTPVASTEDEYALVWRFEFTSGPPEHRIMYVGPKSVCEIAELRFEAKHGHLIYHGHRDPPPIASLADICLLAEVPADAVDVRRNAPGPA